MFGVYYALSLWLNRCRKRPGGVSGCSHNIYLVRGNPVFDSLLPCVFIHVFWNLS